MDAVIFFLLSLYFIFTKETIKCSDVNLSYGHNKLKKRDQNAFMQLYNLILAKYGTG